MTTRLTKDTSYQRPDKTTQEKLTDKDIQDLLEGYVEVEDISKVPMNSHLRYFTYYTDAKTKKTTKKFRYGGLLANKDHYDEYVILSNGKVSWSVQTKTSTFYRKMSIDELKDEYKKQLEDKEAMINRLKKEIKKYRTILAKYETVTSGMSQ